MIEVLNLSKEFKIRQSGVGVMGKLKNLTNPQYKVIKAVDDVSFEIQRGEIVGYLGPNGAGKSTTIKLLTGVLEPTTGSVKVAGRVPTKDRTQNAFEIGVVYGQRSQLWWDLPLIDSFEILGAMYKISDVSYKQNLDRLTTLLQMDEFINQPVRKLSLGQRMRGEIAAALLHEPPILYLDEPTIGVDVVSKNRILEFIQKLNQENDVTVILTTHNLADVEKICPRILIIDQGRIVLDASQKQLIERFGKQRLLVVEFEGTPQDLDLPAGEIVKTEGNKLWVQFDRDQISAFDLVAQFPRGRGIRDVSITEENIESIIAQIYEHGLDA